MQSNTCLVKFNFVCPHCKNVNSKLKTVTFTPAFAANSPTNCIKLICAYCGVMATRIVLDEMEPASVSAEQLGSHLLS